MAESHAAEVIRDAEAIVEQARRIFLFGIEDERLHVEAFERELYKGVDFLPAAKAIPRPLRLKSLQADD